MSRLSTSALSIVAVLSGPALAVALTEIPFNAGTFQVPANSAWTDSGIELQDGVTVQFIAGGFATGNVVLPGDIGMWAGPEGNTTSAQDPSKPLSGTAYNALIGKIGVNGTPFPIGRGRQYRVDTGGRLYLGVNDGGPSDNVGEFVVFISIVPDYITGSITSIGGATPAERQQTLLVDGVPNPSSDDTTIRFVVPRPGRAVVEVFDAQGRRVTTLADRDMTAGDHALSWDGISAAGQRVAAGVYFVHVSSPGASVSRTLIRN